MRQHLNYFLTTFEELCYKVAMDTIFKNKSLNIVVLYGN